ncbi:hypothetical protein ACIQZB_40680 [Streptomyces sp. NPDC097727]|uniref:hypothetical protein n=1 Tax=Streptomyces sp. NPDC097727 TaxID=3366092 RepID=UPI00382DD92C
MAVIRFSFTSSLTPAQALEVLTDFTDKRPEAWPTIDDEHFTVHRLGDRWAEVTEGTDAAWERARYDWNDTNVTVTTLDSKLFGAGGGWTFDLTPDARGSRIDVTLTRTPTAFKGKVLAFLLSLVGPSSLRKSFAGPLKAVA